MTGYGRGSAVARGIRVEVELSSVNRRQFDSHINLPRCLAAAEAEVNRIIHKAVIRGAVTGVVRVGTTTTARAGSVHVNVPLAVEYLKKIRRTAVRLGLQEDLTARLLVDLPDVVTYESATENSRVVWPVVQRALQTALKNLVRMREREGKHLAADLATRFVRLKKMLSRIRQRAPGVTVRYRRMLRQRLARAGIGTSLSDVHVAKEIAIFAERCDITEEIVRLESHLHQVQKLLRAREPVGRTLDFLCQEMFREINTLGAKANDGGISRHVIAFKAELEAVREQVQNIE
ncbi:MAG: YicC family protein [Kiritimatiellae bacterium]|nr:YicC family protein [Kiritimatiellia bacterium]